MQTIDLLSSTVLPLGFTYPEDFKRLLNQRLFDFQPWVVITDKQHLEWRYTGLQKRYPYRQVIPFATRLDNDDVACFDIAEPGKVLIIHDFAGQGWEAQGQFDTFWHWFRQAVEDMIEFEP